MIGIVVEYDPNTKLVIYQEPKRDMPRAAHSDVRQKILHAAEDRLWHYGFKKTTIDEIAADAGVGKGTVYLYFDSKEDIALAIVSHYKSEILEELAVIAQQAQKSPTQKLKEMLSHSIIAAHNRCLQSPSAQEMIIAVKPHIQAHLKPFLEQEIRLIASVVDQGKAQKTFDVEDTLGAARILKWMTAGFWPPYPCVDGIEAIRDAVDQIVDLAIRGMRTPQDHSL